MADDLTTYDDFIAQQKQFAKAEKRTQRSNQKSTRRCLGKVLIALNLIFLVMGATMVGFGVHIHRSKENKLIEDEVAIGVISMGALFLVLSTLGMCAVCLDSKGVLITFEVLLIIMAAGQIAIAVIVLSHNGDARSIISSAWGAADNGTRTDIQEYFNCCGLDVYTHTFIILFCTGDNKSVCLLKVRLLVRILSLSELTAVLSYGQCWLS